MFNNIIWQVLQTNLGTYYLHEAYLDHRTVGPMVRIIGNINSWKNEELYCIFWSSSSKSMIRNVVKENVKREGFKNLTLKEGKDWVFEFKSLQRVLELEQSPWWNNWEPIHEEHLKKLCTKSKSVGYLLSGCIPVTPPSDLVNILLAQELLRIWDIQRNYFWVPLQNPDLNM